MNEQSANLLWNMNQDNACYVDDFQWCLLLIFFHKEVNMWLTIVANMFINIIPSEFMSNNEELSQTVFHILQVAQLVV